MRRWLALVTIAVVLGFATVWVFGWSTTDEERLLLTRSSPGVYHDYGMPQRYYVVKTWVCTAPPAIRARAVLDQHFVIHFESGESCPVSAMIEWGQEERVGPALTWSADDAVGPARRLFAEI